MEQKTNKPTSQGNNNTWKEVSADTEYKTKQKQRADGRNTEDDNDSSDRNDRGSRQGGSESTGRQGGSDSSSRQSGSDSSNRQNSGDSGYSLSGKNRH